MRSKGGTVIVAVGHVLSPGGIGEGMTIRGVHLRGARIGNAAALDCVRLCDTPVAVRLLMIIMIMIMTGIIVSILNTGEGVQWIGWIGTRGYRA